MTRTRFECCVALALLLSLALGTAVALGNDVPDSRDHPVLSRMPGFTIDDYEVTEFASYEFRDR
jgi:hypothetical protein